MGNPGAFSYSHPLWVKGFLDALGSPHSYTASSQDVSNRFAASAFLYGSPFIVPIPDLARTDFLLVVGANPLVSHGSVLSAPRVKDQLHAITGRGGRVVVVDPRRSETARAFEHVAIDPDGDAWMLLSMLEVIFAEGLEDRDAIARQSTGIEALRRLVADHPAEATEGRSGRARPRGAARSRATSPPPSAPPSTGAPARASGATAPLVAFLLDALNLVTGNLDREGGAMFGDPPIDFSRIADMAGLGTYSKVRSRVGDLPEVLGSLPASVMAKEMTTPGEGQIRAMFFSAGNPALSVPNGDELVEAMGELELSVAIDLYVTDTSRHCDFVLPATTMYEREDFPLPFLALFSTPFIQMTEAVVEPRGRGAPGVGGDRGDLRRGSASCRRACSRRACSGKVGIKFSPRRLVDMLLRLGPKGDLFGLRRGGLSLAKLAKNPHGIVLAEHLAPDVMRKQIRHRSKRVRLDPPQIVARTSALMVSRNGHDPDFPLRLIGLRELRSHNSWMHNAPLLMRGGRTHAARIHPDDAERDRRRRRRARADHLAARRDRDRGDAHRRGQARDDRGPARLGPHGRVERRQRGRRRQRQRAGLVRSRRPRAARRDGAPQRDPGARRAGRRPPSPSRPPSPPPSAPEAPRYAAAAEFAVPRERQREASRVAQQLLGGGQVLGRVDVEEDPGRVAEAGDAVLRDQRRGRARRPPRAWTRPLQRLRELLADVGGVARQAAARAGRCARKPPPAPRAARAR